MNENNALAEGLDLRHLPVLQKGPWTMVGQDLRRQGWKLHISCTPDSAAPLLGRLAPLLDERRTPFKFARSLLVLENINAGQFGHTQVGKFITVYPRGDELSALAETLIALTAGIRGPAISTDFHLGGSVYARYGAIHPALERDRLGGLRKRIDGPDGEPLEDTYEAPPRLAADAVWPFAFLPHPAHRQAPAPGGVVQHLASMGLRPVSLVKQRSKGAIVRATSLDGRQSFLIKQGRRWHLSDRWGRDVVWRLRHEFGIHQRLEDGQGILRAVRFEEIHADGFLVFPYVEARDLEAFTVATLQGRPPASIGPQDLGALRKVAVGLVRAVAYLHRQGLVHRDLGPANVLVEADLGMHLIDLEMTTPVGSLEPAIGVGTKGFVSPQQAQSAPPAFGDDVYAVGALLQLMFTGIDPRRLQPMAPAQRLEAVMRLAGAEPGHHALLRLMCAATHDDANERPGLAQLLQALSDDTMLPPAVAPSGGATETAQQVRAAEQLAMEGVRGLHALCGEPTAAWPRSIPLGGDEAECEERDLEPLVGINRGLAGLVYVEAQLACLPGARAALPDQHLRWLTESLQRLDGFADGHMPGLHFGTAGIAVALHRAGMASGQEMPIKVQMGLLDRPCDWPDLMHGAAGQGLAALICGPAFHPVAGRAVAYLVDSQAQDGRWPCPGSVPALAGLAYSGFAHGTAGILYFLATYVLLTGDRTPLPTLDRGVAALLGDHVQPHVGGIDWRYSSQRAEPMHWWCHGGPGIALTLARLYELTGVDAYLRLAERSLAFHDSSSRHGNLGQCHGLSGLGEIYLEMAYTSTPQPWMRRALDLVDVMQALALPQGVGARVWRTENTTLATPDFGVGSAGVVHFLARLGNPEAHLSPPMLLRIPKPARARLHLHASAGAEELVRARMPSGRGCAVATR